MSADDLDQLFNAPEDIYPDDAQGMGEYPGPQDDALDSEPDAALVYGVSEPLNDFGNGKRFSRYFGEDILSVKRVGWFVWCGTHWEQDDDRLEVRRFAQRVSGKIGQEATLVTLEDWELELIELGQDARRDYRDLSGKRKADRTTEESARLHELEGQVSRADELIKKLQGLRAAHRRHAKSAGNTGPINNMIIEAEVDLYRPLDQLNADPIMINTLSGVIQFRPEDADQIGRARKWGFDVLEHSREQMLSKIMPVEYDPAATCPTFMKFIEQVLPDPDVRKLVQVWHGYSLTGRTDEQKLAFYYGGGRNGKSTLVDLIAKMMGAYATTVPIESLTGSDARKGSDATPDLVRLPGARMVRASEPEKGQKMKEATIKVLTGGEAILVRRMQQEFIEVDPEFKLTIQGNHKPDIRGTDDGIWRRIMLIPFLVQIAKSDVDPELSKKLWAERSGVLNWLLEGTRMWLEEGIIEPEAVLRATQEYREESDPPLAFLQEVCICDGDPKSFIKARDMLAAFNFWQVDRGHDVWGSRTVSNHFVGKAGDYRCPETGNTFGKHKASDTGYNGIRLREEFLARMEQAETDARYGTSSSAPDRGKPAPEAEIGPDDF